LALKIQEEAPMSERKELAKSRKQKVARRPNPMKKMSNISLKAYISGTLPMARNHRAGRTTGGQRLERLIRVEREES